MATFVLRPNTPLDLVVQYCDVVPADDGGLALRIKGRVGEESGRLTLEYLAAIEALKLAGLLVAEPRIPESFGGQDFQPVQLRARALRITLQQSAPKDQGDGAVEGEVAEVLTIVERDVRPVSDAMMYLQATDFVIEKVLPRWRRAGVPIGDEGAAAMVHTLFIQRARRQSARES